MKPTLLLAALIASSLLIGCTTTDQAKANITPYPFDTCAVINKPIKDKRPRRRVYDGQEVLFCCAPCVKAFEANPEPYVARIRAAMAAGQTTLIPPASGMQEAAQAAARMGQ